MEPAEFAGFGSPVGSPGYMNVGTPENVHACSRIGPEQASASPLLFRRTPAPGVNGTDSSKKFGAWVMSTSPYAGQKTPPTVSMKSMAAGDENTPPPHSTPMSEGPLSSKRFQAWLKATGSSSWTPRQDAATPTRAPAPTPAGTPMSISHLPASAASPATEEPRSRPLFDLGASETDSDGDETDTIVGDKQIAAAAARMRAALVSAGAGTAGAPAATHISSLAPGPGIRAPAPSPVVSSPAPAAFSQQQADGDSLATPMSHLSMSRRSGNIGQGKATPTDAWRTRLTPGRSERAPSSPVDKVIGLMMEASQQHGHHHSHHTPSRLAAASNATRDSQPAPSPEQQVIRLMLQQQGSPGSDSEEAGTAASSQQPSAEQMPAADPQAYAAALGSPAEDDEHAEHYDSDTSEAGYSSSGTESEDEIDVSELQQLVGVAAAPGTPINDIINMMLTPELKGTPTFGPEQHPGDGVGPRVLFADD